jgi:hypothetical protein
MGEAEDHLALVFHRFMNTEPGFKKVVFSRNGHIIDPVDPFHSRHPATIVEPAKPERIRVDNFNLTYQSYTLPHHKRVTSAEWERYAFPGGYLRNQGFYVYRERRLIIHGTWFGLARQRELTKLCRVRIDLPNSMDELWKVDVRKASAQPPLIVKQRLRNVIERLGLTSERVYKSRGTPTIRDDRVPVWHRLQEKSQISYLINQEHPIFRAFAASLNDDQTREFARIVELISASIPLDTLLLDLGTSPDQMASSSVSIETLKASAFQIVDTLRKGGMNLDDIRLAMKPILPFKDNWDRTEVILAELEE